jgi:3-dehydroquinate synthase
MLLHVELPGHRYPIEIGSGLAANLRTQVDRLRAARRPCAVVVDARVAELHPAWIAAAFGDAPTRAVPGGEASKDFRHLEEICAFLANHRIDRSGAMFAVGGGVIGDLAGCAAALYLRGIPFYQIPTTLLAMVDSSVGGKTGINLPAGKNLVGAFHQPQAVYADVDLLATLPGREFNAGMAEVIKHGMLGDAALFTRLEELDRLHPAHPELPAIVARNCAIKAGIVAGDEREEAAAGGRALLNLGHTFGHAIEAAAGYGSYLHGEAVAIGLLLATRLGAALGHLTEADVQRVATLLRRYDLPTVLREPIATPDLLDAMARDKKVRQGSLRFVVPAAIGRAEVTAAVPAELVANLWASAQASANG